MNCFLVLLLFSPKLCLTFATVACQTPLSMDSLGKNTGVGCHFLLQGIFPTQGWNPGLLHCRQILYPLSHQGRPFSMVSTSNSVTTFSPHCPNCQVSTDNTQTLILYHAKKGKINSFKTLKSYMDNCLKIQHDKIEYFMHHKVQKFIKTYFPQ